MKTKNTPTIDFYDSRFLMSGAGRIFVRVVCNAAYGITFAGACAGIISDILWLRFFGSLLMLILVDSFLHRGEALKNLRHAYHEQALNVRDYIAPLVSRLLEIAFERSRINGGDFVLHLFFILCTRKEIKKGFIRLGIPYDAFLENVKNELQKEEGVRDENEPLILIRKIGVIALQNALKHGDAKVSEKHILRALFEMHHPSLVSLAQTYHINLEDLDNALLFNVLEKRRFFVREKTINPRKVKHRIMNRAWSARRTPFLDSLSEDITDIFRLAKRQVFIGHEKEYEHVFEILSRRERTNALLIGDPGSEMDTIAYRLAANIVHDRVPEKLFDRRVVLIRANSLLKETRGETVTARLAHEGDIAERVTRLIQEVVNSGNIILYFPDIHNLVKGSSGRMQVADLLLPALRDANTPVIAATYPREFKEYIEFNTEFSSLFETVRVQPLTEREAVRYLTYESLKLEAYYGITVTFLAIRSVVSLASRYLVSESLPGNAKKILEEAFSLAQKEERETLTEHEIIRVFEEHVHIPIAKAESTEARKLLEFESLIHKRFINQEEAVRAVSEAVREYRSGLARKTSPIASFLFVGPTGVGKTELSKLLAELQFGSSKFIIRFDMSEFQEASSIERFIGSPEGKIRGALTEAVLKAPYSLILLDEFEKANSNILNLFLQVFDEGRLTDTLGRTVAFQNTIIIATSNVHSEFIKSSLYAGEKMNTLENELKQKLTNVFKPELLNRFSRIVVFKNLSRKHIWHIAELRLQTFAHELFKEQRIKITFDDKVIDYIARKGYDPGFGARPIERVINDELRSLFGKKILSGELKEGKKVHIAFEMNSIVLKVQ